MDVQRYISSGIIESYVVGLVSDQEAREVENAIAEYPEVKAAVEACRQDMERYVELNAIKPPKTIRTRILDAIENESSPEGEQLLPEELREPEAEREGPAFKMPALKINPAHGWLYATALAILLLIISLIFNVYYAKQYKAYLQKYAELSSSQTALAEQTKAYAARQEIIEQELALLKDPSLKWTRLSGNGKHAGQMAAIAWNPQSKDAYLLALSLPEPGPDQQYQLWAVVNNKPVDAGVFVVGLQRSLQKMKPVNAVQVFIITLEKKGGNTTPSLDQIFLAGKAVN